MGPNGSGKSTWAMCWRVVRLYRHRRQCEFLGQTCWRWKPKTGRAWACSWRSSTRLRFRREQYGVSEGGGGRAARAAREKPIDAVSFMKTARKPARSSTSTRFLKRGVNEGFPAAEKRNELLQMLLLQPRLASWTKPTAGWISTPCRSWREASIRCAAPSALL